MKRRDFLFGGAATVGLAAGESEAATPATLNFDPAAMEATLNKIDARMADFREMDFAPREAANIAETELFASRTRVTRAAIRTLYFTGQFMEMKEHERLHPGVQARMARMQPEMDEAVDGMATFLEALTPADHKKVQNDLKADPELSGRIGDLLQQVAKEDGISFQRRFDMRMAVDDFTRRMQTQNPAIVIDPYVQKTRKIQANAGTLEERERALKVRAGEKAFWEFQERSKNHVNAWDEVYESRPRIDLVQLERMYPEDGMDPVDRTAKPSKLMRIGGYLMGAGFGSAALGGIFYLIAAANASAASSSGFFIPALIFGVTVGPALLIAGLIVLIIGGIWYAAVKD